MLYLCCLSLLSLRCLSLFPQISDSAMVSCLVCFPAVVFCFSLVVFRSAVVVFYSGLVVSCSTCSALVGSGPVCSALVGSSSIVSALASRSASVSSLSICTWTWPSVPPPVPPPLHLPPGSHWRVWKPLFGGGGLCHESGLWPSARSPPEVTPLQKICCLCARQAPAR